MSFRDLLIVASVAAFACSALACTTASEETGTSESEIFTCMAMPVCEAGDELARRGEECPTNARCYDVTMCGKTITCVSASAPPAVCLALPVCDDRYVEIESPRECWDLGDCFSRTMCGTTIWCTGPIEADDMASPAD